MVLYYLGIAFTALMGVAFLLPHRHLSPSLYGLYAFTSFALGLLRYSHLKVFFIVRYFFYVMTGFIMVLVPILLILIALLILTRLVWHNENRFEQSVNFLIVLGFFLATLLSVWGGLTFGQENLNQLIDIYSLVAMYFSTSFLGYICWNGVIHLMPKKYPVQTIIVLGMALDQENFLPSSLIKRLDKALKLFLQQQAAYQIHPRIIVTGGNVGRTTQSEASMMQRYLISQGVAAQAIVVEDDALNTNENLKLSGRLIAQHQLPQPIMIVTSHYHLMRTAFLARKMDLRADFIGTGSSVIMWPYYIVREYLAYVTLTKGWNFIYLVFLIIYGYITK